MYYVSALDGNRYYLMLGPFDTHEEALNYVEVSRQYASDLDGRAWFMAWGTTRIKEGNTIEGRMNKYFDKIIEHLFNI